MEKGFLSRIRIKHLFIALAALLVCISIVLIIGNVRTDRSLANMQDTMNKYIDGHDAIDEMRITSDYLTRKARAFAVMGTVEDAELYFEEVEKSKSREGAIDTIRKNTDGTRTVDYLVKAFEKSQELETTELYSMKLAAEGYGIDPAGIADGQLEKVELSAADEAMADAEKVDRSVDLLFDQDYKTLKDQIISNVENSKESLVDESHVSHMDSYSIASRISLVEHILTVIILIATGLMLVLTAFSIIIPLQKSAEYIKKSQNLPLRGAAEYVFLAETYNHMLEETRAQHEELSYEATHDELTGLFNRKMYESRKAELARENCALLIVDVDDFKKVNDTYGHDAGDRVLKKVADILTSSFRFEDLVCRIGGDEFVVIMVRVTPEHLQVVRNKIEQVRERLARPDDLPGSTLSIGAAFSEEGQEFDDLFRNADAALYRTKENGRNGYTVYGFDA